MHQDKENSHIIFLFVPNRAAFNPNALKYIVPQKFVVCFLHAEEIAVLFFMCFPFSSFVDWKLFIMLPLLLNNVLLNA